MAEADLKKQLGTLRYLQGLKAARQRLAAAAQGTNPSRYQPLFSPPSSTLRAARPLRAHILLAAGRLMTCCQA